MSADHLLPSPTPHAQPPRPRQARVGLRACLVAGAVLAAGLCLFLWDSAGLLRPSSNGPSPKAASASAQATGMGWQFAYDTAGRTTRVVDPAGRVTRIRYELDGRQRVRRRINERPDGTRVLFDFDPLGRRTCMTDSAGTVVYQYDAQDRMIPIYSLRSTQ